MQQNNRGTNKDGGSYRDTGVGGLAESNVEDSFKFCN